MRMVAAGLAGVALALTAWPGPAPAADQPWASRRAAMVEEIRADFRRTGDATGRARLSPAVGAALGRVPRHEFVPAARRERAYVNTPLPIGHGQTISQPYIVAIMTELVEPRPGARVLEIGTGSGYQAAVLAELVEHVYSIEIIEALGEQARARLAALGYDNVSTRIGDGYYGWPEQAPYDAIVVTAAASHVPPPLVRQLRPGGRMVIPVGTPFLTQNLVLVEKADSGTVSMRQLLPVRFVPLTGGH